jgi:hypothetical protein
MDESIGRTGKHSEFCEGHVKCPKTGKEECGKVMITTVWTNGEESACQIYCFGCGEQHRVKE